jgi:hypothetical protein
MGLIEVISYEVIQIYSGPAHKFPCSSWALHGQLLGTFSKILFFNSQVVTPV